MTPTIPDQEISSDYPRLEQQIGWYDRKSISAQKFYKHTKIVEIVSAALITFTAFDWGPVAAALGVVVIVIGSLEHVHQWQHNWITYRSTCEALRHEKYAYMARAGLYEGKSDTDARKILAERVEALISTEHSKWISRQEYGKPKTSTERSA